MTKLFLYPQGLLVKPKEKDRLVCNGSFLVSSFSIPINQFTPTTDEFQLHHSTTIQSHSYKIFIIRVLCSNEETTLFDDDASGALKRSKCHAGIASDHSFIINQSLCLPLGCGFGSNVSVRRHDKMSKLKVKNAG